jgi:hypothetical protein
MFKIVTIILIYNRHKPIDHKNTSVNKIVLVSNQFSLVTLRGKKAVTYLRWIKLSHNDTRLKPDTEPRCLDGFAFSLLLRNLGVVSSQLVARNTACAEMPSVAFLFPRVCISLKYTIIAKSHEQLMSQSWPFEHWSQNCYRVILSHVWSAVIDLFRIDIHIYWIP